MPVFLQLAICNFKNPDSDIAELAAAANSTKHQFPLEAPSLQHGSVSSGFLFLN
jgi:hypothetical protein